MKAMTSNEEEVEINKLDRKDFDRYRYRLRTICKKEVL